MKITVKFDQKAMTDIKRLFASSDKLYNQVAYRAMAKVVAGVKTDLKAEIGAVYNLTPTKIGAGIYTTKGSQAEPNFSVSIGKHGDESSAPVSLINYGAKMTARIGVSVQVLKSGARKPVKHGFTAIGKGGNKQIFMRKYRFNNEGPYKPTANKKIQFAALPKKFRLPIYKLTGPRLADAFVKNVSLYETIRAKAVERMKKEVDYQMSMALKTL